MKPMNGPSFGSMMTLYAVIAYGWYLINYGW